MRRQLSALVFLALALGLILAACGGDGDGDDPTGVVEELFKAIQDKQFDKIPDLACAAQKDQVRQSFDFSAAMAGPLEGAGAEPEEILAMLTFTVSGLDIEQVSRSDDQATVNVKGRVEMTVDPTKFNDLLRDVLADQGLGEVSDDVIDQVSGPLLEQFEDFSTDMDDEITLIKEQGRWLICGE
jgi:hypothetical protein